MKSKLKQVIFVIVLILMLCIVFSPIVINSIHRHNVSNVKNSVVTIVSGIDINRNILTSDVIIGTGFCYEENKIITNYHNVISGQIHIITDKEQIFEANLDYFDDINDIAILSVENLNLTPLKFGDSSKCEIMDKVFSVSTPISAYLKGSYSEGMITNTSVVGFSYQRFLQTNVDLSPGCSGAPLVSYSGKVIGMTTLKSTEFGAEGLGFAIPSDSIKQYLKNMSLGIRPYDLGITFNDIFSEYGLPSLNGITITNLAENSVLRDILKEQDVVMKVNDIQIRSVVDFYEEIYKYKENTKITVVRNGEEIILTINLQNKG